MAEVASAYVSLLPSAKNWGKQVDQQVSPELDKAGKSTGSRLSGAISGVLKKSLKTGGLVIGGVLGAALFKGFSRLSAIDEARAKLTGLGNTTKTVDKIMANALTSVKGTAFGLGDAATIAASAVAAGIKPGQKLTKYLRLTADAASITGDSLADMGRSMNNVQTLGAAYNDTLQIFAQKGIPVYSLLSKRLGVSAAKVKDLASEGKISAKVFNGVLNDAVGGAAKKAGGTFQGALANMGAALGRFGAALLTGVFPIAKQVFGSITGFLDDMTAKVGPLADSFAAKLPAAFAAVSAAVRGVNFGAIAAKLAPLTDAIQSFAGHAISAGKKIGPALLSIGKGLAPLAKASVVAAFVALTTAFTVLGPVIDGLASAFAGLTNFVKSNQTTFKVLAGLIGAVLLPVLIQSTVAAISSAASTLAMNAAWLVYGVTIKAIAIGTKLWTAAQWLLNAALIGNPIGAVIIALVALGALFVVLWKKSNTFRTIVTGAFNAVKNAALTAFNWVKSHWPLLLAIITGPIGLAVYAVAKNWGRIKSGASNAVDFVKSKFNGMVSFFKGIPGKISGIFSGIWHGVASGLKTALNLMLHLPLTIPRINTHIPGVGKVGGQTLIPALAAGGKVTEPTLALIGEAGTEYVIPEKRMRGIESLGDLGTGSGRSDNGGPTVQQNIYPQPGQSEDEIGRAAATKFLWAMAQ